MVAPVSKNPAHSDRAYTVGRTIKTSERVADAIIDLVREKGLMSGDRLPNEAEMLELFGVGRGSLREALRILEVFGLISLRSGPGGGPVLCQVNPKNASRSLSLYLAASGATIGELAQARYLLEPLMARKAAESRDPDVAAVIYSALEREAVPEQEPNAHVDRANDFHYALARSSPNAVLNLLATALKEMYTSRLIAAGLAVRAFDAPLHDEHKEIGAAVIAGDAPAAERLARQHFRERFEHLQQGSPGYLESRISWS